MQYQKSTTTIVDYLRQRCGMAERASLFVARLSYATTLMFLASILSSCASDSGPDLQAQYEALEAERLAEMEAEEAQRKEALREAFEVDKPEPEPAVVDGDSSGEARSSNSRPSESSLSDDELLGNSTDSPSSGASGPGVDAPDALPTTIGPGTDTTDTIIDAGDIDAGDKNSTAASEDSEWSVTLYPSPVDGIENCSAVTQPRTVMNGDLATQVNLVLTSESLYFRTDATLDISQPEAGFRIDAGFPVRFDDLLNEVTAVVDQNLARLIDNMQAGFTLSVTFSYEPQLSANDTYVVEYDIEGFSQIVDALQACAS